MNIDLKDLLELADKFGEKPPMKHPNEGPCIAVLDRGFVYQGNVSIIGDWVYIDEAQNVRVWGTTNGLGELALNGPTPNTVLDKCGSVKAPLHALIALLPCKTHKW